MGKIVDIARGAKGKRQQRRNAEEERRLQSRYRLIGVRFRIEARDEQRGDEPGNGAGRTDAWLAGRIAEERPRLADQRTGNKDQRKPATADQRLQPDADDEQRNAVADEVPIAAVQKRRKANPPPLSPSNNQIVAGRAVSDQRADIE